MEEEVGLDEDELLSGALLGAGLDDEEDDSFSEELEDGFSEDVPPAEETSLELVFEGFPLTEEVSSGFSCFEEVPTVGSESVSLLSSAFEEVSGVVGKSEEALSVMDESGSPSLITTSPFLHALRQNKRLKAIKQMNTFFICGLLSSLCDSIISYHRANFIRKLDKNMRNFYLLNKG